MHRVQPEIQRLRAELIERHKIHAVFAAKVHTDGSDGSVLNARLEILLIQRRRRIHRRQIRRFHREHVAYPAFIEDKIAVQHKKRLAAHIARRALQRDDGVRFLVIRVVDKFKAHALGSKGCCRRFNLLRQVARRDDDITHASLSQQTQLPRKQRFAVRQRHQRLRLRSSERAQSRAAAGVKDERPHQRHPQSARRYIS